METMIEGTKCASSMEEVLERCRKAFVDVSGQERLFSRDMTMEEFRGRRQRI
ncbi:MAG: hypothetical protein HN919_03235 [Verrucomicrobia bacterium]|jgi:hypothetical protein|nr:hypothetical protein [Verrucomicrobiota bacterium]MBT7065291.1 hypothetical protein [Verrucomicrobiota bacterium]MBT7698755.1 hypothetical protein [Verrucomicrobiota bacterium]